MRRALAIGFLAALTSCGTPGQIVHVVSDVPTSASIRTVYLVKSGRSSAPNALFLSSREAGMSFARTQVSVPPLHTPGDISTPRSGPPDPVRHFVLSEISEIESARDFHRSIPASPSGERVMFVHGYNVNAVEAIFSAAQIHKDFDLQEPIIAFAWPSAGRAQGYVHDRDSVFFARSDLAQTLASLTADATERVSLVAHSMGAALTMEALRELAVRGDRQTLSRISPVILVAPDVDPEVFRRQARDIGDLPQPFVVFVASNDRALRLSSILSFQGRLGSIQSPEDIGDLDVTVLDFSQLADGPGLNHEIALTSPAAIRLLTRARNGDPAARRALESYLVTETLPLFPD